MVGKAGGEVCLGKRSPPLQTEARAIQSLTRKTLLGNHSGSRQEPEASSGPKLGFRTQNGTEPNPAAGHSRRAGTTGLPILATERCCTPTDCTGRNPESRRFDGFFGG
ncbi:putative molybdate-ATP binding lipoprotein [Anopheles sinensis]|uniref:Putative molybdate-ATP binding lipoprotein n=1 Tax=Anopheles sinensis TaxID=74873 RepID=A0A084VNQ8_ANOSI|nr:putative molybdate-ATP binding lipoprotein [Anopheles sinensis]